MNRITLLTLLSLFALSVSAKSLEGFLYTENLNQTQLEEAQVLLKYTEKLLPTKVVQGLPKKLSIHFFKSSFQEPTCESRLKREATKNKNHSYYSRKKERIYVNIEMLKFLKNSKKLNCPTGSTGRFLFSSVLHEFFHAYDFNAPKIGRNEKNKIKGCPRYSSVYKKINRVRMSSRCRKMYAHFRRKERISSDIVFKNMILWQGKQKEKFKGDRVTDFSEVESLADFAATNFEKFILDPEYKCRRPSHYAYFRSKLKARPYAKKKCQTSTKIVVAQKGFRTFDLNPKRLYQIDYVISQGSDSLFSPGRFGHSAFRLVMCAPHRKEVSKECLKDHSYHMVVDYRANVHDLMIDSIKGIFGKYSSKLFIYSMSEMRHKYAQEEMKDLYAYPLLLTKAQRTKLLAKILEAYWEYKGSYRFISNNCATEAFDLVASTFHKLGWKHVEGNITPVGVLKDFVKFGLIDKKYKKSGREKRLPNLQVLRGHTKRVQTSYKKVYGEELSRKQIKRYIKKSTASERREDFKTGLAEIESKKDRASYIKRFLIIEGQALITKAKELHTARTQALLNIMKKDEKSKKKDRLTQTKVRDLLEKSEQDFIKGTYGIPSRAEVEAMISMSKEKKEKAMPSVVEEMEAREIAIQEATKELQEEFQRIGHQGDENNEAGNIKFFETELYKNI